ncbi:beta-galactosidase-like [Bidens hawaiensis]|uniref:beta-galactosidase-like n=1 Tax=Bidens hawaiensis TaxID=980011 RepID=UPI00404A115A
MVGNMQEGAISILHDLPAWSICILHDDKDEVFNTVKVKAPSTQKKMTTIATCDWQSHDEEAPSSDGGDTFAMSGLYEQLNVTRDASDYLWYLAEIDISPNEQFLTNGQLPVLTVIWAKRAGPSGRVMGQDGFAMKLSHLVWSYYRNSLGITKNPKLTFSQNVKLRAGVNKIYILSVSVGLAVKADIVFYMN